MNVTISFVGYLKVEGVANGDVVQVEEGTTVADLLTRFKVSKEHQKFVVPIVNGEEKKPSCVLQDGDELSLFLPMGGG